MEKLETEMESMGLQSSDDDLDQAEDLCRENDVPFQEKVDTADSWRETNKVVPAVVVLRVTACRSFDTELPSSGSATGFVVDKQRGIILTSRHVVSFLYGFLSSIETI
ncbi:hypothetical protein MANES_04G143783v8 [Manihot esculenta]|uniref:Uncharacterized protein n=1 Tax=Manihot esculenta TaxID=3983 RepID=A0ACB7HX26_MANES|nr:hypothetical protein MANES_04G143783v8 [Manihot esculenta]